MLIRYPTQTQRDLDHWARLTREDEIHAGLRRFGALASKALQDLLAFAASGPCWVGTSWGKESTIVTHLAALALQQGVTIPVVWFKPRPNAMPGCEQVRDDFLSRWPIDYHEIDCEIPLLPDGTWGIDEGYDPHWHAYHRDHPRHVLGLRADESRARRLRMWGHGLATQNTLAPLGWWHGEDVFAYLHHHDLPTHPTYAMSMAGAIKREKLRVAALGGEPGVWMGRDEWERRYYGMALDIAKREARSLVDVRADQARDLAVEITASACPGGVQTRTAP